jgi:anti-sigma regulatory factor (Ser/Thr protein kinase)
MERMVADFPRSRRTRLAPEVTAPRRARDFVAQACAAWHAEQFSELGQLVVSELVSNAVLHSGTGIELELRLERTQLRLQVHDDGGGVPAIVPEEERTVGGVGLGLVSRAVQSWGVTADPRGGKDVWCVLVDGQA